MEYLHLTALIVRRFEPFLGNFVLGYIETIDIDPIAEHEPKLEG